MHDSLARVSRKKPEFPILLADGSCSAKIYAGQNRGRPIFTLVYQFAGRRVRQNFAGLEIARTEGMSALAKMRTGDLAALELTGADRAAYVASKALADGAGVSLHTAVEQFVRADKRLGGKATIAEAVEYFVRYCDPAIPRKTPAEVLVEFLAAKKADGLSAAYHRTLRIALSTFAKQFDDYLANIAARDLDAWLRAAGRAPRTRNNLRAQVITLFRFAQAAGYLPRDKKTEAELTARAKVREAAVEIFTPDEVRRLLAAVKPKFIPFVALCAFAGLRTEEALRLDWGDVKFDQGVIEVSAAKAKTASRRLVPIQPNLAAWLSARWRYAKGPVCKHAKWQVSVQRYAAKAGINWHHNGLRHSFASYRLPIVKSAAEVALEMGNSPKVIFAHYRELATEAVSKEFWAILPPPSGIPLDGVVE